MMQTHDAIIFHQKMRYLDPTAICETRNAEPSKWKDNDDKLANCETLEEKKEKRMSYHKDAMKKVAVYIGVMMAK
jgi:hypothetical protein